MTAEKVAGDAWAASCAGGACTPTTAFVVGALLISAAMTAVAIRYARHRHLIDQPGQRRSHAMPTPRGGGIGIVVAVLMATIGTSLLSGPAVPLLAPTVMLPPLLAVALVGWIDDHRGLSAVLRVLVHFAAAAWVFAVPLLLAARQPDARLDVVFAAFSAVAVTLAIAWSVNLHNFMDGIDGILSMQALFVFVAIAALLAGSGHDRVAVVIAIWTAAVFGFLPFNFPRARIFMGDVGSGVLGFLVAMAVLVQMGLPGLARASGLALCVAFVVDAGATLASRMLQGRRWYHAHREHLYQWLVRSGLSHVRVTVLFLGWNLLIVLPTVLFMNRDADARLGTGIAATTALYGVSGAVWIAGKQWCLRQALVRRRTAHARRRLAHA